ncbi:DUF2071 domain-containing protein [Bacillus timonensis]|nr:DUF2071 domain-containing protein [Bacillus timonensis]
MLWSKSMMKQTWSDLLFIHYEISTELLQKMIPSCFTVDCYRGKAYIGVVPFKMENIYPFGIPIKLVPNFLELNVRTYVTYKGEKGVYFFSLDANSPLSVFGGRNLFHLNYVHAQMICSTNESGEIYYKSRRTHKGEAPAEFEANYEPKGDVFLSKLGSIDEFLTERYVLFTTNKRNEILRGRIEHERWQLQHATCKILHNSMISSQGIDHKEQSPLLHFSKKLHGVKIFPLERL